MISVTSNKDSIIVTARTLLSHIASLNTKNFYGWIIQYVYDVIKNTDSYHSTLLFRLFLLCGVTQDGCIASALYLYVYINFFSGLHKELSQTFFPKPSLVKSVT